MAKTFPQQFFIPDIYPEQIPTLLFDSDSELLKWVTDNEGGYDFIYFMYTAIEHAIYNSFQDIEVCRLTTPSVKISMVITQSNYINALTKIIELGIEGEYYELCSEASSLIKLINENKKYFE
jgi:hypothetical protein